MVRFIIGIIVGAILTVIHRGHCRGVAVAPGLVAQHWESFEEWKIKTGKKRGRAMNLTPRETEIAAHVVFGRTYRQVADDLGLSRRTVEKHIERIFRKTGVRKRKASLFCGG